jgi:protein-tyrosine-phosphatase
MIKGLLKRRLVIPAGELWWRMFGDTVRIPDLRNRPESILFICKGNICRSPFAEAFARSLIRKEGDRPVRFGSAGIEVERPLPPPPEAINAAKRFGVRMDGHRARRITERMAEEYDCIVGMETRHVRQLRRMFPRHREKILLLPLFEDAGSIGRGGFPRYDISDPYGKTPDHFLNCFARICTCVKSLLKYSAREDRADQIT